MHAAALEDLEAPEQEMLLTEVTASARRERPIELASCSVSLVKDSGNPWNERAFLSLAKDGCKSPRARKRFSARGSPALLDC